MTVTREMLAAYADGQLGPEEAARVEAAIKADPEMAREVEAHRQLRQTLNAHFAPILDRRVPDRLMAAATAPETVVDLAGARRERAEKAAMRSSLPRWMTGGAIAASLAIGFVMGGLWSGGNSDMRSRGGELFASGALDKALTTQLASAQDEKEPMRILLSFKAKDGQYCRGFEGTATAGIACREEKGWNIIETRARARERENASQYRQAGSAQAEIMAAAQDMAKGGALDADAERAARNSGWRP